MAIFNVKLDTCFKFILLSGLIIDSSLSFHIIHEQGNAAGNDSFIPRSPDVVGQAVKYLLSKELPYVVMVVATVVEWANPSLCTGTMITDDKVLTLATCLLVENHGYLPEPDNVVVYGRPLANNTLEARSIIFNPYYKHNSKHSDFAVIVTEKSKRKINYPRLPENMAEFQDVKYTGVMAGFGNKGNKTYLTDFRVIHLNKTRVLKGKKCGDQIEICLHFKDIMPCAEDRGGPIIVNGTLYALYNPREYPQFMTNCCYDVYFTVFTPVYSVKDWLEVIMDTSTNFEWLNKPWCVLLVCCFVFGAMAGIYYGLVEALQMICDPADMMQIEIRLSKEEEEEDQPYMSPWGRAS